MAGAFTVSFLDKATEALRNSILAARPEAVLASVAEDVTIEVQDHLRRMNSERANTMGGKRTNFYADAAANTTHAVSGDTLTVSINKQGIRQRFEGGEIKPQNKKWITIPARSETYGRTAREFDNLRFIQLGQNTAMLVESDAQRVKFGRQRKDGSRAVKPGAESGGLVMFWLKKSVTQPADASILPTMDRLGEVALSGARDYVTATFGEGGLS